MAGSLQQFGYYFDSDLAPPDGSPGATLMLDESNQRAVGNNPGAIVVGGIPGYIQRFSPRYVYWIGKNNNGETIRRKIVIANPSNLYYLQGGALDLEIYPGTTVQGFISGAVGEKKTFVAGSGNTTSTAMVPIDTGITDGSQP